MFRPQANQLSGLSYRVAELYGKPHIQAHYKNANVKSNTLDEDACCVICGARATNSHHTPPLSKGRTFLLRTYWGQFILKPALFAVCGSGTTGCHNDFHGGARYRPEWVWYEDEYAEMWWDGTFLRRHAPHGDWLYNYGFWRIHDLDTNKKIEIRN